MHSPPPCRTKALVSPAMANAACCWFTAESSGNPSERGSAMPRFMSLPQGQPMSIDWSCLCNISGTHPQCLQPRLAWRATAAQISESAETFVATTSQSILLFYSISVRQSLNVCFCEYSPSHLLHNISLLQSDSQKTDIIMICGYKPTDTDSWSRVPHNTMLKMHRACSESLWSQKSKQMASGTS